MLDETTPHILLLYLYIHMEARMGNEVSDWEIPVATC